MVRKGHTPYPARPDKLLADGEREAASHHAAGSAVGYVFQLQYALLTLVPHALADEDAAVSVEVYDDVAFHLGAGRPKEVLQIHHALKSTRQLLDTSAKTWRTLAIWVSELQNVDVDERRNMSLVTTQQTRPGSALEALTERAHNLDHAVDILARIAADPKQAKGTAEDRATFAALGPEQQRDLLSRVSVNDGVPRAADSRAELEKSLVAAHESRFISVMADLVEAWWWPRVLDALVDRKPVAAAELREIIDDARRNLTDLTLPIWDIKDLDAHDVPAGAQEASRFVRCLNAIELNDRRVGRAIDDFLRAAAHRSYWLRSSLVLPRELVRYDDQLLVEWDDRCDRAFDDVDEGSAPSDKTKAGRAVYDELTIDAQRPLRDAVREMFVQRGSLHLLADRERLAWHPDEAAVLREQLKGVTPS